MHLESHHDLQRRIAVNVLLVEQAPNLVLIVDVVQKRGNTVIQLLLELHNAKLTLLEVALQTSCYRKDIRGY